MALNRVNDSIIIRTSESEEHILEQALLFLYGMASKPSYEKIYQKIHVDK